VPRQELAIKAGVRHARGPEQVRDVVQRQLVATMASLQEFTRLKATAERDGDLAWLMMLDALIFQAEAEARWLELCEAPLARTRSQPMLADGAADGAGAVRDVERTL
jgi:Virulence activator alpha C-term